jgi:hypothetical protein
VAPTGLAAVPGPLRIALDWTNNAESDLRGYHVYRATTSGGAYTKITTETVATSDYLDTQRPAGVPFFYKVTAVDFSGNESPQSAFATASADEGGGTIDGEPWINELHYDNVNTDTGEFVEIAGPAGLDLSPYTLELYNGSGGATYDSVALAGRTLNSAGDCVGFTVIDFPQDGIQNGAPDGLALIKNGSQVIQFLSYEGSLTATAGTANGQTSVDIGVAETNSTPVGQSLQLGGDGAAYGDFAWQEASTATRNAPNNNQTFQCGSAGPPAQPTGLVATPGNGQVVLTWSANTEGNLAGYDVYRTTTSGGVSVKRNPTLLTSPTYTDTTVLNGVPYYYTVTAVNTSGESSVLSDEVTATPVEPVPAGLMVQ